MTSASPTPRIPASRPWLSRNLIADPRFGPLPGLLLLLTVVTGFAIAGAPASCCYQPVSH